MAFAAQTGAGVEREPRLADACVLRRRRVRVRWPAQRLSERRTKYLT